MSVTYFKKKKISNTIIKVLSKNEDLNKNSTVPGTL